MTYMMCCVTIAQNIVSHESSVPQRHPKPPAHHPSEAWDPNILENTDAKPLCGQAYIPHRTRTIGCGPLTELTAQ